MGKAFSSLCHKTPCRARETTFQYIYKLSIVVNNMREIELKASAAAESLLLLQPQLTLISLMGGGNPLWNMWPMLPSKQR